MTYPIFADLTRKLLSDRSDVYVTPTTSISRRKKQSEERAAFFAVGWMRLLGDYAVASFGFEPN